MSDTQWFYAINGLAGKNLFFDRLFQGISNDYFSIIVICLVLVWLWFSARDIKQSERNQRAIVISLIGVGLAMAFVDICNLFYFRGRPFNVLPADTVHLLFYKPHDSSFPSNFTAVVFALSMPIWFANKKYGTALLILALLSSFGRVYIGVHYPLDIIGGIGFAAAGCLAGWGITILLKPLFSYVFKILRSLNLAS